MRKNLKEYVSEISNISSKIQSSYSSGARINSSEAVERIIGEISAKKNKVSKVIIIGNGGSASIANHMAVDLWKNAEVKAISFSDSALLTCVSNDFSFQQVFEKPIEMFSEKGDLLIAISSSGNSENILRGVAAARKKKCKVITMSGFNPNNALRQMGDLNFYVPSNSYGYVEIAHSILCHFISDRVISTSANG